MFGPEDVGREHLHAHSRIHAHQRDRRLRDQHRDGNRLLLPAQHLRDFRRPDDRAREPPVGGSASRSACRTGRRRSNVRSPGRLQLQRLRDRSCRWPISCSAACSSTGNRRRSRWTSSRNTSALYGQDTWRAVAERDDELRGAVGALVPAAAPAEPDLQLRHRPVPGRDSAARCSRRRRRDSLSGRRGLPDQGRACSTEWLNIQPRVGVSWDPSGNGRTSVRAGYGMNSNFVDRRVLFRRGAGAARSAWSSV